LLALVWFAFGWLALHAGGGNAWAQATPPGPGKDEYIIEYTYKLAKGEVDGAFFSPNQKYVVTLTQNGAIRLWDTETARLAKEIRTNEHQAQVAVYHPKAEIIFTGGKDKTIRAWDVAKGTSTQTFEGNTAPVTALITDAEGKLLFSGAADGKVMVWDVATGKMLRTLNAHTGRVTALAVHPNGKFLATGGNDRVIKVWDYEPGKQIATIGGHTGAINALAFAPSKPEILASASADGTAKLWKWQAKDAKDQDQATFLGHKRSVTGLVFHPNGQWLITSSLDETIKVWDVASQRIVQELNLVDGPVAGIGLESDGRRIVAAYAKDQARTWKLDKSAFLAALTGHQQSLEALDFSHDNQILISASLDKTIRLWNVTARAEVKSYDAENHQVQAIRFAPDDKTFATGGADGTAQLWETGTGKILRRFTGHVGKVNAIAFHPTAPVLLTGGSDKTWMLWDLNSGRPIKRTVAHNDQVGAVDFSPDGKLFATGSDDASVRIWKYPSGELANTLTGAGGAIEDVRFDATGKYLAAASQDGAIRVYNPADGTLLYTFTGHDFIVSAIRFSADSRALISVSRDKTVKLWDLQTGKFIRTVSGERNQIVALAVSPDGTVMATGSLGRDIDLMVYPLKVELAQKTGTAAPAAREPTADETAAATAPATDEGALEKDMNALTALDEAKAQDANTPKDALRELDKLQVRLNQLLRGGRYCDVAPEMEQVAFQILNQAAYDRSAYLALVYTGIVQQDLKQIYLMSRIGQMALFVRNIYTYDLAQSVQAKLDFWQNEVFNPAIRRSGRDVTLEFIDCQGKSQLRTLPAELLAVDIPQESLAILAAGRVHVNFAQFKGLDTPMFLQRVATLIDVTARVYAKSKSGDPPVNVTFQNLPPVKFGTLQLDLSNTDLFGYPAQVPFKLRRERGPWLSFVTDGDRRKRLLVPEGNYYLMVDKRVKSVYSIREETGAPVATR
jgi:WD40 repeat protein